MRVQSRELYIYNAHTSIGRVEKNGGQIYELFPGNILNNLSLPNQLYF